MPSTPVYTDNASDSSGIPSLARSTPKTPESSRDSLFCSPVYYRASDLRGRDEEINGRTETPPVSFNDSNRSFNCWVNEKIMKTSSNDGPAGTQYGTMSDNILKVLHGLVMANETLQRENVALRLKYENCKEQNETSEMAIANLKFSYRDLARKMEALEGRMCQGDLISPNRMQALWQRNNEHEVEIAELRSSHEELASTVENLRGAASNNQVAGLAALLEPFVAQCHSVPREQVAEVLGRYGLRVAEE